MRRQRSKIGQERAGRGRIGAAGRIRWSGWGSPLVVLGLACALQLGLVGSAGAAVELCPNEALRVGRSASLPDCRAYELVTPANLGRTQALTFTGGSTKAAVSAGGEGVALQADVPLEPNPSTPSSIIGARAVFSRNPSSGWEMKSAVMPGASAHRIGMNLFSPDLSQVAFHWTTELNTDFAEEPPDITYEAGPVGGPYEALAIPRQYKTEFVGASANFSHVLFTSFDHELPLSGPDGAAAGATDRNATDLYDWTGAQLQLVNLKSGALVSQCGATLGAGVLSEGENFGTVNAVSSDGSKIFFAAPDGATASEPGCKEPIRLYMQTNDGEPIEVSAPERGVHLASSEIMSARYDYATPDGSKVFFNTETPLTAGETAGEESENKLFEYDTEEPEGMRLKRIASGVPVASGVGLKEFSGFFFSEDGSTVYIESGSAEFQEIDRYDTSTGEGAHVASVHTSPEFKRSYSTPNGEFFLFPSIGVDGEPRGAGHEELYRYDYANRSLMCVTCGTSVAPERGEEIGIVFGTTLSPPDATPAVTQISENGQEVFFQATAQLVPQDTNSTRSEFSGPNPYPGLDVYEWEADGTGECELVQGCTRLLSSGEASGPSRFIGASKNGRDVFFESPAQLVPQATPEFPNIYDAREDGGFAPPPMAPGCLSCQGVGSPPPLFSPGASLTFVGAGNPVVLKAETKKKIKKLRSKHKKKRGGKPNAVGHNVRARSMGKRGKGS